jgi:pyruvate dehydrogenase E2 component (dihydrolipoamide acetyltransferase)
MTEFKMPSLGADMDEGKLLEWKVQPGDAVKRGQVIAVVDTSKAAVEVEAWADGVVSELLTQPGETVAVGTVMARIHGVASAEGISAKQSEEMPAPRKPASPAARKRARALDVDVGQVTGTGAQGAVTVEDVERAARIHEKKEEREARTTEAPTERPPVASAKALEMRRAIAAAMSRSKREIPHYYLSQMVPMRRALDWLTAENAKRAVTERLLMGVLQLKAVALTLREFPDFNGFWKDGAYQPAAGIHVGVAISLRQGGLVAPAIHDVAELALDELMRALSDLVLRARAGSLRSSEMSDPTVTVTNLGDQGVDAVHGVIYPPQVALVGFGRLAERPWAENGMIGAMPTAVASLSADHRASDGHRGARFLAAIAAHLQEPGTL